LIDPLRSEAEAFRFLLWSLAVAAVVVVIIVLARAVF
jgi:hypothetical protein